MLRKIHSQLCGQYRPWWQTAPPEADYQSAERDALVDQVDEEAFAAGRQKYLAETKRKPPTP